METREFNLVSEPWVRVLLPDCSVREVSLRDALLQSHGFRALGGELPTQNVAVLRLMLAVLHTVFSRAGADGEPNPIDSPDAALFRWRSLWERGSLPEKPIRDYFEKWKNRFWLFDPERPFWQTPSAANGTEYKAPKLIGELSESSNKTRLFPGRTAEEKVAVKYAEAARWLLNVNAFDDTSSKPKKKNLPSPGAGWLGKLGMIYASGDNLFETLMLNLTLLKNGADMWGENRPCWELDAPRSGERVEIAMPDNQAQLLTLQSRRLLLQRDGNAVTGYSLLGGDFFLKENADAEQMTVWGTPAKKSGKNGYQPRRHDSNRQLWRDYASIFIPHEEGRRPGVVLWIDKLRLAGIIEKKKTISFSITTAKYGDKDFFITDTFGDSLTFHTDLLTELGKPWQARIEDEINRCDELAYETGRLAGSLCKAAGGDAGAKTGEAKRRLYHSLDAQFRVWLASLDPEDDGETAERRVAEWRETAKSVAKKLGRELVDASGPAAFVGRYIKEKENGKGREKQIHYSAPEAYKWFQSNIKKIYET